MKDKLTPLQLLRMEKREAKELYEKDEKRLAQNWDYLTNNMGTLFLNTTLKGAKNMIGISSNDSAKNSLRVESKSTSHSLMNGLVASFPLIWEIAQPLLIRHTIKKVKSLFTSKKKKQADD